LPYSRLRLTATALARAATAAVLLGGLGNRAALVVSRGRRGRRRAAIFFFLAAILELFATIAFGFLMMLAHKRISSG
jgi:hypothetical protein